MTDPDQPRPRPAYGEYATPEEQRARIRVPDASAALSAGETPAPAPAAPERAPVAPAPTPGRLLDRMLTIGLLAFGLINVVTSVPAYLDYVGLADRVLDAAGADATFTALALGRSWGLAAAVLLAVLWAATALLSVRQLRRGRLAFWIPLVGAAVAAFVVGICLLVPLLSDPAVVQGLLPTPTPVPTP